MVVAPPPLKSTSKTGTGGARSAEATEENRKPYCLVKTTEAVSCRTLAWRSEKPPQSRAEVMAAMSGHSTRAAYCTPRGGTTLAPGRASRASASRRYSSADSPRSSVPKSSDTTTSGNNWSSEAVASRSSSSSVPRPARTALRMSSRVASVESFSTTWTTPRRKRVSFSATLRRASSARLFEASRATTRFAPSDAASIASSPDPVPISSTIDSPGTIARSRHAR
mmetsp:Transcript_14671/g.58657  ORF Transcript_14671/g.58657 Transcript_14671/m.58657 type:complete len:224 (+) Transcript_14671:750-1421(+)